MDISQYSLEALRADSDIVLFRGRGPGDAVPILVLVPAPELQHVVRRLENEYALRDDLDAAWAAPPLALVSYDGRKALVLEDIGGDPLEESHGRPIELTRFLKIAVGLTAAIGQVHARGLVHKDIKPGNVLLDQSENVRLTGFGFAAKPLRDADTTTSDQLLAGTFAYMSPEQTGRMNRPTDSRSDLYSLGVTLYEMLTGSLPFTASDAKGWIHCHIARPPPSPSTRLPGIPGPIEAIILKLLAKMPEDRYKTASGVERDLRVCLAEWQTKQRVEQFPLGKFDISSVLQLPDTLYGRRAELERLTAAFDRVETSGTIETIMISGYSGVGKSSILNDFRANLVQRGLFAVGKFDQYKRNIPYATLTQAFGGLVSQLLGKSERELSVWREELIDALGPNGQLIVNIIPQLAVVIGEQRPVADASPLESQGRFQRVLRRFIGVFARQEHPIVMLLDDLQWADVATLDLLTSLAIEQEVRHVLVVGAYRDNEVNPDHPLMRALERVRDAGHSVPDIPISPLAPGELERLIADALSTTPARVHSLANLVFEKTGGNPFFAIQFVSLLADQGLVAFDAAKALWDWDLTKIRSLKSTDNVASLMAAKLGSLPETTREAIAIAACLGSTSETSILTSLLGGSEQDIRAALDEAIRAGALLVQNDSFEFVHDRIQEAAYSLIPEHQRPATHLRIGRALASRMSDSKIEEAVFDIVDHFNRGAALVQSSDERSSVARLNLIAGKRAKHATAYQSALMYVSAGCAMLGVDTWSEQYRLKFDIEMLRAECELLSGNLDATELVLKDLSDRAKTTADKAAICCLEVDMHVIRSDNARGVDAALACLRIFGIDLSPHPSRDRFDAAFEDLWRKLDGRGADACINLPRATDGDVEATMSVLQALFAPAAFHDATLLYLNLLHMVDITLRHGATEASPAGLGWFGVVLGHVLGKYSDGYQFARLGDAIVERHGFFAHKAKALLSLEVASAWVRPIAEALDTARASFAAAVKGGDLATACFAWPHIVIDLLVRGDPLDEVWREIEKGLAFAGRAKFRDVIDCLVGQNRFVQNMRGETVSFSSFDGDDFSTAGFEAALTPDRMLMMMFFYWAIKGSARFMSGDFDEALKAFDRARPLLPASQGHLPRLGYEYFSALAMSAIIHRDSTAGEAESFRRKIDDHLKTLQNWAVTCPSTFADKFTLVSAEVARFEGRDLDAMRLYEKAIELARENDFAHHEAIGHELAANFYASRGFTTTSRAYLKNARSCYLRWGAAGKVRQLEQQHPFLRVEAGTPASGSADRTSLERLDRATVVRISQAISSEIDLRKLIDTLMAVALEHSGGERAVLILADGDELRVEAEGRAIRDSVEVNFCQAPLAAAELPETILRYVLRSRVSVLIDDVSVDNPYSDDEYFRNNHSRSILCLPLVKYKSAIGLMYIENTRVASVFTLARLDILDLLSSQAGISIENARLYHDLQRTLEKVRQAEAELRLSVDLIPALTWSIYPDSTGAVFNKQWHDYTGVPADTARDGGWLLAFHPDDREKVIATWRHVLSTGSPGEVEARILRFDGVARSFLVRTTPLHDEQGNIIKWYGTNTDIDDLKRADMMVAEEKRLLEMVGAGLTLADILGALCLVVEKFIDSSLVSIRLLDRDTNQLRHGAAPTLGPSFTAAVDDDVIGPGSASCGTAAYRREVVETSDIAVDPLWARSRQSALDQGVRSCWSAPTFSFDGEVLGTFAIYSRKVRQLTPQEVSIAGQFSRLTGIIIERKQAENALKKSETLLADGERISHTGSWTWNAATEKISWSAECARIFGFNDDEREVSYAALFERVHPDDRDIVERHHRQALQGGGDFNFEHRIALPDGKVTIVQSRGKATLSKERDGNEYFGTIIDVTERRAKDEEMRKLVSLIENSNDFIGYTNFSQEFVYLNDALRRAAGIEIDEPASKYKLEDFISAAGATHAEGDVFSRLMRNGNWEGESVLQNVKSQAKIPVYQTIFFVTDTENGNRIGIATICRNITEQKQLDQTLRASLAEKVALLKEVHHRVKNNLQLISSLLNLQAARIPDVNVSELFAESRNRVRSMALVHENLYSAGDFGSISMRDHVQTLCAHLVRAYAPHAQNVKVRTDIDDVDLDLDRAVSVGLIANELVSNALKHAFPDNRSGNLGIALKVLDNGVCVLSVEDDGVGFPPDFDPDRTDTVGLQLIRDLTQQLHGVLAVTRDVETCFSVSFAFEDVRKRLNGRGEMEYR